MMPPFDVTIEGVTIVAAIINRTESNTGSSYSFVSMPKIPLEIHQAAQQIGRT
jgi:hypothetical protein